MSKLSKSVNDCLAKMSSIGGTQKGSFGEQAVLRICEEFYQNRGGILYHSFSYKTDPSQAGNIKKAEQGTLFIESVGSTTEIDVLLVTKYRVYVIEVKAYKSKKITLKNNGIAGCFMTDKSPVHQNEMHCRHLYSAIFKALPNGDSSYIVPIVVFVDKCVIEDERNNSQKNYVKVTVLNSLKKVLMEFDKPMEYCLDLETIDKCLIEARIKYEKYFKLRTVR